MEKKLLEEIKRINTINGGGKLINEGIPGVVADFWTDIFRKVSGKADDVSVSVSDISPTFNKIIDEVDVPEETLDDLMEIINNPNHWDTLSDSAKRNVMKVYAEIDEIATPIYEALVKGLKKENEKLYLPGEIRKVRVDNPGMTYDEAVEEFFNQTKQVGFGPIVAKKLKNEYNAYVAKMARISKTGKILQKFGYTRNLGRIAQLLNERGKKIDELIVDLREITNRSFESTDNAPMVIKQFRTDIENKLLAIENLMDGGAQETIDDILSHFKKLKKEGRITEGQYNTVKKHFESITKGTTKKVDGKTVTTPNRVWTEIIEPLNDELAKEVNGWKSFYDRIRKTIPVKRVKDSKGNYGWTLKDPTRLVNFILMQSTQTGKDILKRYISSSNGKYFFDKIPISNLTKTALQTYLRSILVPALVPSLGLIWYGALFKGGDYLTDDWDLSFPPKEWVRDWGLKYKKAQENAIDEDGFFQINILDNELGTWTVTDLIPQLGSLVPVLFDEVAKWWDSNEPEEIVVPDTPTTDSDSTVTEPNLIDKAVNATNVLPQGLKNAIPDKYEDQVERVGGVWIFHDDTLGDLILKKGKVLKNDSTDYPFKEEYKRATLDDDVWYALGDKEGSGKYEVYDLAAGLQENMKRKGLSILLEQFDAEAGKVDGSGSSSSSGSNSDAERANQEQKRKEELGNRMLAMFEKFQVNDRDSERNLLDKLSEDDKESIKNTCFDLLVREYNGISKIEDKIIDDTLVNNAVIYLINNKKMDPFKITYNSPLELEAKLMESVGLEKILFEQVPKAEKNTIYINYLTTTRDDDKFELIRGAKAEQIALDSYNKRVPGGVDIDEKTPTPSPTPRPKQTNEPRPEEAMEIETPDIMKRQMKNE